MSYYYSLNCLTNQLLDNSRPLYGFPGNLWNISMDWNNEYKLLNILILFVLDLIEIKLILGHPVYIYNQM